MHRTAQLLPLFGNGLLTHFDLAIQTRWWSSTGMLFAGPSGSQMYLCHGTLVLQGAGPLRTDLVTKIRQGKLTEEEANVFSTRTLEKTKQYSPFFFLGTELFHQR